MWICGSVTKFESHNSTRDAGAAPYARPGRHRRSAVPRSIGPERRLYTPEFHKRCGSCPVCQPGTSPTTLGSASQHRPWKTPDNPELCDKTFPGEIRRELPPLARPGRHGHGGGALDAPGRPSSCDKAEYGRKPHVPGRPQSIQYVRRRNLPLYPGGVLGRFAASLPPEDPCKNQASAELAEEMP